MAKPVVSHTFFNKDFMLALILFFTLVYPQLFISHILLHFSLLFCATYFPQTLESKQFKATYGFATDWSRQVVGLQKVRGGVMAGVTYGIRTILQYIFPNTCSTDVHAHVGSSCLP